MCGSDTGKLPFGCNTDVNIVSRNVFPFPVNPKKKSQGALLIKRGRYGEIGCSTPGERTASAQNCKEVRFHTKLNSSHFCIWFGHFTTFTLFRKKRVSDDYNHKVVFIFK